MRLAWIGTLAMVAACGAGTEAACPTDGALLEGDAGCDCVGEVFELHDNGETCTCGAEGLDCVGPTDTGLTSSSTGCRRGVADTASGCG